MTEQNKNSQQISNQNQSQNQNQHQHSAQHETKKVDNANQVSVKANDKVDSKKEEKKAEVKKSEVKVTKKEEAVARGVSVHMSKRHGMYISNFIKGKKIDQAISELEDVIKLKRAIPFKGEIPHRKGMMSGRYPVNASKIFISLLKALKGNSIVNGLDLEKTRIFFAHSTFASRPRRKLGKAKRAHITLKAKEFNTSKESTKESKEAKK